MKLLLQYLKPYRWLIGLTLTIKTSATLIELAIPYILSHILDRVVPARQTRDIFLWGVIMLLCALLAMVGNVVANRMVAGIARRSTQQLRHTLFERILCLSAAQMDAFTIPSLESRLTSDTYHVHHFVGMTMRMGIRAPILLVGGIIVTATLEPVLTLVMVIILPLIALTVGVITKRGVPLFQKTQRSVDGMIRVVREDAQGIRVIKALSRVDYERRKYDKVNRTLAEDEEKSGTVMAASNPLVTFLLNLGLVSVMVVGAFRVNGGLTAPGKIIAFIQYFTLMSNAMLGMTRIFVRYSRGAASAGRIEEVILTEPDLTVKPESDYPPVVGERGIVFERVSFSYLGKTDNLSDLSFVLPEGGILGIIGATGSGKSTVGRLLMRFYDVREGSIRIDGRDVRTIPHEELNTRFGVVMQNDFLYRGSIRENIDFGRGLPHAAIVRAAKIAQAEEFISAYEDGYDHEILAKGSNLSGGQKQRLLIARAVAGDPELLILDDASSALDYKTDSTLRRAIREEMKGVTTVVVAQRVSSVMHADLILVLEEGRLIGAGRHGELLTQCEVYRQISDSQIGGAILE